MYNLLDNIFVMYQACRKWKQLPFRWQTTAPDTLQWRHNERDGVLNHQLHNCLLKRLFRRRLKKTPKLRVTGLSEGN